MRSLVAAIALTTVFFGGPAAAQESVKEPRLLLTPQRLRRLQRDRKRQTARWLNFEKRVQTVADSPERGFELALYYAVTEDEAKGREAVEWVLAHPCEQRQVALVLDWAGQLISEGQNARLRKPNCPVGTGGAGSLAVSLRNSLFISVASDNLDNQGLESANKKLLEHLTSHPTDPVGLYASAEYLMTIRSIGHVDLRQDHGHFFSQLPKEFLLSLDPGQLEHPEWMSHMAALALVALDPNLENSQFLQGWAMEDRQSVRDGPGVAYEFLWADPYLPGIAYQNMDPWIYDPDGRLFARASWDPDACWISVDGRRHNTQNCGQAVGRPMQFGTLTIVPPVSNCIAIQPRKSNETLIVWQLKPYQELVYDRDREKKRVQADAAGLWQAPNDTAGKVCTDSKARH